jgi:hypothetical protein
MVSAIPIKFLWWAKMGNVQTEICCECGRPYEEKNPKASMEIKMCPYCWKMLILSDKADDREK